MAKKRNKNLEKKRKVNLVFDEAKRKSVNLNYYSFITKTTKIKLVYC